MSRCHDCVRAYVSTRKPFTPPSLCKSGKHKCTCVRAYLRQSVHVHQEAFHPHSVQKWKNTQVHGYARTQVHLCFPLLHVRRYICISVSERPSPPALAFRFSCFSCFSCFFVFFVFHVFRVFSVSFPSHLHPLLSLYQSFILLFVKFFCNKRTIPLARLLSFFVPLHMRTNATTREGRCQYTQKGQSVRNKAPKRTHPITP